MGFEPWVGGELELTALTITPQLPTLDDGLFGSSTGLIFTTLILNLSELFLTVFLQPRLAGR